MNGDGTGSPLNGNGAGTTLGRRLKRHGRGTTRLLGRCRSLLKSTRRRSLTGIKSSPHAFRGIRIRTARDHGQTFIEDALIGRLEIAFLLNELFEVRALHFLCAPARLLEVRVKEVLALRVQANCGKQFRALETEVLETRAKFFHLDGMRFDSLFALTDEREHDRRNGRFGARRWNECFGRSSRVCGRWRTISWRRAVSLTCTRRRSIPWRRSAVSRRSAVRRGTWSLRRSGRESIHGGKIRQSAVTRNRDLNSRL